MTLRFKRLGMGVGVGLDGEVEGPAPDDARVEGVKREIRSVLEPLDPPERASVVREVAQRFLDEDRANPAIALGVNVREQSRRILEGNLALTQAQEELSKVERLSEEEQRRMFGFLFDELAERAGPGARVHPDDFRQIASALTVFLRDVRRRLPNARKSEDLEQLRKTERLLSSWIDQAREVRGLVADLEVPRVWGAGEVERKLAALLDAPAISPLLTPRTGVLHPKVVASLERARAAAREVPLPPANSPANFEVLAMSAAHYYGALDFLDGSQDDVMMLDFQAVDLSRVPEADRAAFRASRVLGQVLAGPVPEVVVADENGTLIAVDVGDGPEAHGGYRAFRPHPAIRAFLAEWRRSSYARLEVGHRLAASLCLTDVPEDAEVRAPWGAWSLVVPDGLLGDVARVWCLSAGVVAVVSRPCAVSVVGDARCPQPSRVTMDMIRSLVVGACLALSEPDDFRKERQSSRSTGRHRRSGAPDFGQVRYLLSAPVRVDLRDHVRAALDDERAGRRHSSPKVQFLVRGHWRNQAHGPRHALRRRQWIPPFWKGNEDARVLLRAYRVEEP